VSCGKGTGAMKLKTLTIMLAVLLLAPSGLIEY
jgi:hypothetical protein